MKKLLLPYFACLLLTSSLQAEPPPEKELTAISLQTTQEIPNWLNGTFVHNGPADCTIDDKMLTNWYEGSAMLHAFRFKDGQVFYTNKYLHTGSAEAAKPSAYYPNADINVAKFNGQPVALTEVPLPVLFDLQTLDTKGLFTYEDKQPKRGIWESAHPHRDAETGEIINYFVEFGKESLYYIYRLAPNSAKRESIAQLIVDEPSYMHSFAITPHYIILVEFPFIVTDPQKYTKEKISISAYQWIEGRPLRFLVVNRQTGKLIGQYKTDALFAFHHINSYEKNKELIIDLAAYPDASVITNPTGDDPENRRVARFCRYHLDLQKRKVIKEQLGPSIEMPRINYERYNGKPYEHVYGVDDAKPLEKAKRRDLIKIDVKTKKLTVWSEEGCFASEPIFVAAPNSKSEDDGVILSIVFDSKKKQSFLLVLKANSFKELGRAAVPHAIALGQHGDFFR